MIWGRCMSVLVKGRVLLKAGNERSSKIQGGYRSTPSVSCTHAGLMNLPEPDISNALISSSIWDGQGGTLLADRRGCLAERKGSSRSTCITGHACPPSLSPHHGLECSLGGSFKELRVPTFKAG